MSKYNLITAENAQAHFGQQALQALTGAFSEVGDNPTLILPTGGTPKPLYQAMRDNTLLVPDFRYINLDQYKGIEFNDPRSYPKEIKDQVLAPLGRKIDLSLIFNAMADDPALECARIEQAIVNAGGIDIAIIGIGPNGHIAFNEPGADFNGLSHIEVLTPETKAANALYCDPHGGVPDEAYTLGLATIMGAKKIILLTNKPDITAQALHGDITKNVPASILQHHSNLTVVATPEVGKRLQGCHM